MSEKDRIEMLKPDFGFTSSIIGNSVCVFIILLSLPGS